MNFEIQAITELTGNGATIYTVILEGKEQTSFESFLNENEADYPEEVEDIVKRLYTIGKETGARDTFFKLDEGKPGDGVCALYDRPDSSLRLYCIR